MIRPGLPGLNPAWSRHIDAPDAEGNTRSWHVLDNGPLLAERGEEVVGTVLCVHGNPTWSYLWRRVIEQAPTGWRVVAVDHLGMGYSERLDAPRSLAQRIEDLGALSAAMELGGPIIPLAHDWGGPIATGWLLDHPDDVAGLILTNTAVHQRDDQPKPLAITTTRARPLLDLLTARTPAFIAATTALSRPALPKDVRRAFAAPYTSTARRDAVRDFVADVPFEHDHPTYPRLQAIAEGLTHVRVPALFVWGTNDPVFSRRYLDDLQRRVPHADVQVYPDSSHLVLEDSPEGVGVIWAWIVEHFPTASPEPEGAPADEKPLARSTTLAQLEVVATDGKTPAIVERGGQGASITREDLNERVNTMARALRARGVSRGQRVAVLIPPGIDLNTVVYAVWRLGGVVAVADAGLGLARLGAALRSASPDFVVGIRKALVLARATRVPGVQISAEPAAVRHLLAEAAAYPALSEDQAGSLFTRSDAAGACDPQADVPESDSAIAAILFTSGATGPPKGVVYTRGQLRAQMSLLRDTFELADGEGFVAAFAPFALYGPPLGLPCAVPNMDVTAPHTLTAAALADAVAAVHATVVFASPAALRNVVATAADLTAQQREVLATPRLVMSAGAPVPTALLRQVKALMPLAQTQTPYGMTEVLPVASIDPTTLADVAGVDGQGGDVQGSDTTGSDNQGSGVCVGPALVGVQIRIAPLTPQADDEITDAPGVLGEIVVRAPHVKLRYHRAWGAQQASAQPAGWHRTGDVGELDSRGRLWVQGRRVHVVHTANGPLAPYPVEHRIATLPDVVDVALVGVGPPGTAQAVAIIVPPHRMGRRDSAVAEPVLAAAVREVAGVPIAAVLVKDWLPVDIRHASKVDRTGLAHWADTVLHGRNAKGGNRFSRQPTTRSR